VTIAFEGERGGKIRVGASRLEETSVLRLEGQVQADGSCAISIAVEGEFSPEPPERRHCAVGLVGIGYARKNNALERVGVLESLTVN
jgi:hypothetical protein